MANHSRDEMDKMGKAHDASIAGAGALFVGALGLLGKAMIDSSNQEKARNEIIKINNRIDSLKGEYLGAGGWLNDSEIRSLEAKRAEWEKKLK